MSTDNKFFPRDTVTNRLKKMRWQSTRLIGLRLLSFNLLNNKIGWGGSFITLSVIKLHVAELLHIRVIVVKFLESYKFIKGIKFTFNSLPKYSITKKHLNSWMGKGKGPFIGSWLLLCWQYKVICILEGLSFILLKKFKFFFEAKFSYLNLYFKIWKCLN